MSKKNKKASENVLVPDITPLIVGEETYYIYPLSVKGLFSLSNIFSKLSTVINFKEVFDKSSDASFDFEGYVIGRLIAGIPFCHEDFVEFVSHLTKKSKTEVEELPAQILIRILEIFVENEDLGELIGRFFELTTKGMKVAQKEAKSQKSFSSTD